MAIITTSALAEASPLSLSLSLFPLSLATARTLSVGVPLCPLRRPQPRLTRVREGQSPSSQPRTRTLNITPPLSPSLSLVAPLSRHSSLLSLSLRPLSLSVDSDASEKRPKPVESASHRRQRRPLDITPPLQPLLSLSPSHTGSAGVRCRREGILKLLAPHPLLATSHRYQRPLARPARRSPAASARPPPPPTASATHNGLSPL